MPYLFSNSGKNICLTCERVGTLLEGSFEFLETDNPCRKPDCGYQEGGRIDVTDVDPRFVELWTKINGETPTETSQWMQDHPEWI
jgi:hypothetical protein